MKEEYEALACLETIDISTFMPDSDCPKEVCCFILALAQSYNDLKDILMADQLLNSERPKGEYIRTREWGAYSGILFHLLKDQISSLHELLVLIRGSRKAIHHSVFNQTIDHLSRNARCAWQDLVAVADNEEATSEFGKNLILIRNKITFHYDAKALGRGYESHFCGEMKRDDRAFISRGTSMRETRFYFADAASFGYVRSLYGQNNIDECVGFIRELALRVAIAIKEIVVKYINVRGAAFREFRE